MKCSLEDLKYKEVIDIENGEKLGFIDDVEPLKELELERRLVQKITTFIMELGSGFSFIGNQHTLTCNDKE